MLEGHTDCGTYSCNAGSQCAPSGGCMPKGAVDCGDGKYCKAGLSCGSGRYCLNAGDTDCGDGHSCTAGNLCRAGGGCEPEVACGDGSSCRPHERCAPSGHGCMPEGVVECGVGHYCDAGDYCGSGDTCRRPGDIDCGNGHACSAGLQCMHGGCRPEATEACGASYCAIGTHCGSGNHCLSLGDTDCGDGHSCSAGNVCRAGGCTPKIEYIPSGVALIGGATWIYGYNVPPGPAGAKLRKKADEMLQQQERLNGIKKADFIDPHEYNFIIGIAASSTLHLSDLPLPEVSRLLLDELRNGRFSAKDRALYASLRHREFDRMDCHSNGAMICLAALELGDAKTKHVRLFGPQITPTSLSHWQKLIESGKVQTVELFINKGDPIPGSSYMFGGGSMNKPYLQTVVLNNPLMGEIRNKAPGIKITTFSCPGLRFFISIEKCHDMAVYQQNEKNRNDAIPWYQRLFN